MTEEGGIKGKYFAILKSCRNCKFLMEDFGECCHPKGGGISNMAPSMENCLEENDWAWWERKEKQMIGEKNYHRESIDPLE
jgi:hypothetical protein